MILVALTSDQNGLTQNKTYEGSIIVPAGTNQPFAVVWCDHDRWTAFDLKMFCPLSALMPDDAPPPEDKRPSLVGVT